jgi:large subunit ribosomal protein L22
MLITATQKYTRQSPRKVRLVANAVRKLSLDAALKQLAVMDKRASMVVMKTIRQAIANAMNNQRFAFADLSLDNILISDGPKFKRFQAVSRGRAHSIIKRASHITVILKTADDKMAAAKKEETKIEPAKEHTAEAAIDVKESSKGNQQTQEKKIGKVSKLKQPKVVTKKTVNRTTHK